MSGGFSLATADFCPLLGALLSEHTSFFGFLIGMTIALLRVELAHGFAKGVEVIYETANRLRRF